MSNVRQHPDWWLGADGRWYPPPMPPESAMAGAAVAPAAASCPMGHPVPSGAQFCGSCGQPVTARPAAGAPLATAPAAGAPYVPAPPARRPAKSPVAFLPCLGAVVLVVAPFLPWLKSFFGGNLDLVDVGQASNGSSTVAIAVAVFAVVAVVFVLPLTPLRPSVAGSLIVVIAVAGAAVAVPETIALYRHLDQEGASATANLAGPSVAVVGMVLVLVGGIAYGLSGRRGSSRR